MAEVEEIWMGNIFSILNQVNAPNIARGAHDRLLRYLTRLLFLHPT